MRSSAAESRLLFVDRCIESVAPLRGTLNPKASRATSLVQLGESLSPPVGAALADIALSIVRSFPGNLFWDFDWCAQTLTQIEWEGSAALNRTVSAVTELQELFGPRTAIRFAYAHDFIYGFDWAKWCWADRAAREYCGPLSEPFLEAMRRRALEIQTLIVEEDRVYPSVKGPRNAFGFARDVASERRLHRALVQACGIPLRAWEQGATPEIDRNYRAWRSVTAERLELAKGAGSL
ncbi:MAG: hypothetical protein HRU17_01285 [Polyangiaceae bacterium]|nr:hypothetical protein [Polyangiaceae bacterium]